MPRRIPACAIKQLVGSTTADRPGFSFPAGLGPFVGAKIRLPNASVRIHSHSSALHRLRPQDYEELFLQKQKATLPPEVSAKRHTAARRVAARPRQRSAGCAACPA